MKLKKLTLLFLFSILTIANNILSAQFIKSINVETGLIAAYHHDKFPNLLSFYAYEAENVSDLVWISNVSINILSVENIGFQIGMQYHNIQFRNPDYTLRYETGGIDDVITRDYNHSIIIKSKYYEVPISLILFKSISDKLDLNLLIGGSPMMKFKNEYKITNKINGTTDEFGARFEKTKVKSNF